MVDLRRTIWIAGLIGVACNAPDVLADVPRFQAGCAPVVKSSQIAFDANTPAFLQSTTISGECLDLRTLTPTVGSRQPVAPVVELWVEGKFVELLKDQYPDGYTLDPATDEIKTVTTCVGEALQTPQPFGITKLRITRPFAITVRGQTLVKTRTAESDVQVVWNTCPPV